MSKIRKGVILAAGLGTRFLPVTKVLPKEMLPVLDKPVLQYTVEELVGSGMEEVVIIINKEKRLIEDYFSRNPEYEETLRAKDKYHRIEHLVDLLGKVKISYAYQNEALGNGHALLMAKELIGDDPFVCSEGDSIIDSATPAIKQLLRVYKKYHAPVIGVQQLRNKEDLVRYGNVYGRLVAPRTYRVEKFVEKPALENASPDHLVVGGMRYVFTKEIWSALEQQQKGKDGEIWMADAANALAQKGEFYAYIYRGKFLDTGDDEKLMRATKHFYQKRVRNRKK
ncbi:MAG TPA: sugar phosphate nucleotidyltransferase [Patescibacteria group bacterium]|nr:sugar phosphate nucleotidyltransferase [Patescibacteria group bacterium]